MASISTMYPHASIARAAGAAVDFLSQTKGFKDELLKVGGYSLKWFRAANQGQLSAPAAKTLSTLEGAKNLVGVQEFLMHGKKLVEYAFRWITGAPQTTEERKKDVHRPTEMFFETVEMVNPAKDALAFAKDHQLMALDTATQTVVDSLGSAALMIGPGRAAKNAIATIGKSNLEMANPFNSVDQKTVWQAKSVKAWFDLAKYVSYVALGVILAGNLIATAMGATAIATMLMQGGLTPLVLTSSALISGLASYFHERLSVLTPHKV